MVVRQDLRAGRSNAQLARLVLAAPTVRLARVVSPAGLARVDRGDLGPRHGVFLDSVQQV